MSLGTLRGIVLGNWDEVSETKRALIQALAKSRATVMGPSIGRQVGGRGEGSSMRRTLRINEVKAQCMSLHGRLWGLEPGSVTAFNRRREAVNIDMQWRLEPGADNQGSGCSVAAG